MTWIVDNNGTRWVDTPPRKTRKPARALRFANIKVGDQIMVTRESKKSILDPNSANEQYIRVPYMKGTEYCIVTDLWFDPVAGQRDPISGEMVGIARINPDGTICDSKYPHTKRGLASNRYKYADHDYIAACKARLEAMKSGDVVGIGYGKVIRRRPKMPGSRL